MKDYSTTFTNTQGGAFPATTGKNASSPTSTDGTEFVQAMIDDEWGARQALMVYAGLTPNAVTESSSASQALEAMKLGFISPGTGVIWWHDDDPATTGDRVLLLNGQGILRANYALLDAAVYVGDGSNAAVAAGGGAFYRADDAAGVTPNIAGNYLILPDLRGYVLRGLDVAASVDPDGASRFVGDAQVDAFQAWQLGANESQDSVAGPYYGRVGDDGLLALDVAVTNTVSPIYSKTSGQGVAAGLYPVDDGTNGTPRTDSETRMTNVSTRYGIRY